MQDWIEFGRTFDDLRKSEKEVVGLQVEVDGETFLVGDINHMGGQCDCCCVIRYDEIVTKYRRVFP